VGLTASTFPGTASSLDLDDVELGVVDCLPDGRSDFLTLSPSDSDETVAVSDDTGDSDLTLLPESVIL
jgi:hypothetical protein